MIQRLLIICWLFLLLACSGEEAIPIIANFEVTIVGDDYSVPVSVLIDNKTKGAENFQWVFPGGNPESSSKMNPGTITYQNPGDYLIELTATNRDGSEDRKSVPIKIDTAIEVDFDIEIAGSLYAPATVNLNNLTKGATSSFWTFENGEPENSTSDSPKGILFNSEGTYQITLEVNNGLEYHKLTKQIEILPKLSCDFDWNISLQDSDYQVPITLFLKNKSLSASQFYWTFGSGNPSESTEENPQVTFNTPGIHTITLQASNDKETITLSKTIEVSKNTNLNIVNGLKLGINTAHTANTRGALYSTINQEIYAANQVNNENSASIDLVFFGLNANFSFNKFVSPDEADKLTFPTIANASHTKIINSQEHFSKGIQLTASDFDAMTNDEKLKALVINDTQNGLQPFDYQTINRIVLFQTSDGRKGAIKIIAFISEGQNSYIIADIKVQKQAT